MADIPVVINGITSKLPETIIYVLDLYLTVEVIRTELRLCRGKYVIPLRSQGKYLSFVQVSCITRRSVAVHIV